MMSPTTDAEVVIVSLTALGGNVHVNSVLKVVVLSFLITNVEFVRYLATPSGITRNFFSTASPARLPTAVTY